MKSLIILAILALAVMPLAIADGTGGADGDNDLGVLNDVRDFTAGHDHSYDVPFQAGIGVDLVVYENEEKGLIPDAVTVESRLDLNNSSGSVYIVAKYNIWERFFKGE